MLQIGNDHIEFIHNEIHEISLKLSIYYDCHNVLRLFIELYQKLYHLKTTDETGFFVLFHLNLHGDNST